MTSYNGKSLTYDEIGNPVTYGTYEYDWTLGRRLSGISEETTGTIAYCWYNDEGIRTVKVANGVRHEYDVTGGQINREIIRSSGSASSAVMKELRYYYDASGRPVAIRAFTCANGAAAFTEKIYYLQTNLQGDIVAIYNDSGTLIGSYTYDAWGNCTATVESGNTSIENSIVKNYNPFRYRGYYYDYETSMYYLQSRYYVPAWGRFLNADGYVNAK